MKCLPSIWLGFFLILPRPLFAKDITLAFVGDVIVHERIRLREEKTNEGFHTIWSPIQNYLEKADFTYANLEGPVAPEYGGLTGFPLFNFPEKIIPALKEHGFDVVSTANNHALDRQAKGVKKTIENLKKYQLNYTGTMTSEDNPNETWWTLTPIPGSQKNIAWLACTEMTNGNPDKENQVLYCFKHIKKIKQLIQNLKSRDDIGAIILLPHWGEEDVFDIEPHIKRWARMMLEQGASAVVGSHPHIVRRIDAYTTKDKRRTLIAYSLGNFVSNQSGIANKASIILYLKFKEVTGKKQIELADFKYLPIWTTRTIQKDSTAKYRIDPVWDDKKVPSEASEVWKIQLGNTSKFKSEGELNLFLN